MSSLAKNLRCYLFAALRELDECDLSQLYHEAQAMVQTNRKLRRGKRLGPADTLSTCCAPEDKSPFSGINEADFQ